MHMGRSLAAAAALASARSTTGKLAWAGTNACWYTHGGMRPSCCHACGRDPEGCCSSCSTVNILVQMCRRHCSYLHTTSTHCSGAGCALQAAAQASNHPLHVSQHTHHSLLAKAYSTTAEATLTTWFHSSSFCITSRSDPSTTLAGAVSMGLCLQRPWWACSRHPYAATPVLARAPST